MAGKMDATKPTKTLSEPSQMASTPRLLWQTRPVTEISEARALPMKIASQAKIGLSISPGSLGDLQPSFGFKTGQSGAHAARTGLPATPYPKER